MLEVKPAVVLLWSVASTVSKSRLLRLRFWRAFSTIAWRLATLRASVPRALSCSAQWASEVRLAD